MNKFTVLFRSQFDIGLEEEEVALKTHFPPYDDIPLGERVMSKFCSTENRTSNACVQALVIGRYACLPFYRELEEDLRLRNSALINTYRQHSYIADMMDWYQDLVGMTPRTWSRMEDVPEDIGSVILKGKTNSRKHLWDTHMFANNREEAMQVYCRLLDDTLISTQEIYIREFVPLKTFFIGLHGLPITEEFRFFVYKGMVLAGGYYWSSHVDDFDDGPPDVAKVPDSFLEEVIRRVGDKANFYVIDVAKKEDGEWMVVELNDGQQSGLSEVDPDQMYGNLKSSLVREGMSFVG